MYNCDSMWQVSFQKQLLFLYCALLKSAINCFIERSSWLENSFLFCMFRDKMYCRSEDFCVDTVAKFYMFMWVSCLKH